jgi:predicted TIM-barrel fold metal-dependent hydrolase
LAVLPVPEPQQRVGVAGADECGSVANSGDALGRRALDLASLPADGQEGRPLRAELDASADPIGIGKQTQSLGVPVVLVGAHYTTVENALRALEQFPHLRLETSALAHFGAIKAVVASAGAERLLFGTRPAGCPNSPLWAVLMAEIGDEEKQLVLGGNAARLFGLPEKSVDLTPPALPARIFDVHCHFHMLASWPVPQIEERRLLPALGRFGVARCVASSLLAITSDLASDVASGNALTAAACSEDGQLGYLVADPNDLELTAAQLALLGSSPGIVGVKVHCQYARQPTDSSAMRQLFRLLAAHGRPVKIHNDGDGWAEALLAIAREHPQLPIIVAHGGPGYPTLDAAELAVATENVYIELPSSFGDLEVMRGAVARAGSRRLLFGSDATLLNPAFILAGYVDAGVHVDNEDVFWNNARGLFAVDR